MFDFMCFVNESLPANNARMSGDHFMQKCTSRSCHCLLRMSVHLFLIFLLSASCDFVSFYRRWWSSWPAIWASMKHDENSLDFTQIGRLWQIAYTYSTMPSDHTINDAFIVSIYGKTISVVHLFGLCEPLIDSYLACASLKFSSDA
jgi:hypothetical protein